MKTTDNVSCELRKIEKEIDNYYKSNPLVKLPFATAAWSLLAFGEEMRLIQEDRYQHLTFQDWATIGDNFVGNLKYPIYWIHKDCKEGGKIPSTDSASTYKASQVLYDLGSEYAWFNAAYTYASWGWIELELQGKYSSDKGFCWK